MLLFFQRIAALTRHHIESQAINHARATRNDNLGLPFRQQFGENPH